jgi:hypothetical protein
MAQANTSSATKLTTFIVTILIIIIFLSLTRAAAEHV